MKERITNSMILATALAFGFLLIFIVLLIMYRLGVYSFVPKPVVETSTLKASLERPLSTYVDRPSLGVATDDPIFQTPDYDRITRVYDAITVENALKWIYTENPQGVYHWTKGDLAVDSSASVTLQVAPTSGGPLTNSASVAGNEYDLNPGNSSAQAVTTVFVPASAQFIGPIVTNGYFQVMLLGEPGLAYVIEASSDLRDWSPIGTVESPDGVLRFSDPAIAGSAQRFYRLRQP